LKLAVERPFSTQTNSDPLHFPPGQAEQELPIRPKSHQGHSVFFQGEME
jgi:acyl-coenzyme A thioesterase PaaI-like protein